MTWPTAEGTFHLGDMPLQQGGTLPDARIVCKTYGTLNAARDNVIVYPTATARSTPTSNGWSSGRHASIPSR